MKNKDYRELQISSSLLIFIFLGIIIVGIVIFLLGVSVGKKQAQVSGTLVPAQNKFEEVVADKTQPTAEDKDAIGQELAGHVDAKEEDPAQTEVVTQPQVKTSPPPAQKKASPPAAKSSTPTAPAAKPAPAGQYYLQIGAFRNKDSADSVVEKYQSMGFPSQVITPSSSDSRQLYRVVIGGYNTRADALQAKTRLVESEGPKANDYFIVQR